ncbi:MAG: TatD family hydrolase [Armatimonadota bacterium]
MNNTDNWSQGLVDTHVHLVDIVHEVELAAVVEQCHAVGIVCQFSMGTCADDWPAVMDIAAQYERTRPFIGLHPWYADRLENSTERLSAFWNDSYIGVGEIGLDKLRGPDIETQIACFRWQLEAGLRLNRPVSVHCVRMWGKMVEILSGYAPLHRHVAIHAYGGSADTAHQLVEMGVMVSVCGTVFGDDRLRLRKAVSSVPDKYILLETDAPALMPQQVAVSYHLEFSDGKLYNHPANLLDIAERVAMLRDTTLGELTALTARNSFEFYTGETNV